LLYNYLLWSNSATPSNSKPLSKKYGLTFLILKTLRNMTPASSQQLLWTKRKIRLEENITLQLYIMEKKEKWYMKSQNTVKHMKVQWEILWF